MQTESQCQIRSGDLANHLPSFKWKHFKYRAWHAEHKSNSECHTKSNNFSDHQVVKTKPPRDRNFWQNAHIVLPTFFEMEQEGLAQGHMEVTWATTADLLGLQITERHTTAFFSFSPFTRRPKSSLDWRFTTSQLLLPHECQLTGRFT